jgi:hypothetical protein
MAKPSKRSVLGVLTRPILLGLADAIELAVPRAAAKPDLIDAIAAAKRAPLPKILDLLKRDDLKEICRAHGLDDAGREKALLRDRILDGGDPQDLDPAPDPAPAPAAPPAAPPVSAPQLPLEVSTGPLTRRRTLQALDEAPHADPHAGSAARRPSERSVLAELPRDRLIEVARVFNVAPRARLAADPLREHLLATARPTVADLLQHLNRDELRQICARHGLDATGRARAALVARILHARGEEPPPPPPQLPDPAAARLPLGVPTRGQLVRCRHRNYLVEETSPPLHRGDAHRVRMVCLDDDDPGRPLEVLWELELGAHLLHQDKPVLGDLQGLDPPRAFAAYLHAIKWNGVTASDSALFQAPFRAGIALSAYQLTPLMKALELPRANLFIADDVGLGKTIEAGLVLQELLLRQRVDFILVVAPPAVCLQWQGEMEKRFGLRFEIHDRAFVARRRRERGFGVNPWSTANRFIISYPLLRRPDYQEPLLAHLSARGKKKTLLVLDEAHTVAPSTQSHYATDSKITQLVRDALAPAFENRLFLSATPHNGHPNSFSALLEILDPQRFTRGVRTGGPEALRPVMVRRLKRDIRGLTGARLPERQVPEHLLWREGAHWFTRSGDDPPIDLGPAPPIELELADLLRDYTALIGARSRRQRLVFINLQKRLLSSVAAFHRTLQKHAATYDHTLAPLLAQAELPVPSAPAPESDDELDPSDESLAEESDASVIAGTRELGQPDALARDLLATMLRKAAAGRAQPDARVLALLAWIRRHMCPAAALSPPPAGAATTWSDRRVLIFTESLDTKRYLRQLLSTAFERTDRGDQRILELHGAMADDAREEVQRAFNAPPEGHPVRVLLATDAAREGINLQGACADLFHFDIPWNPARMEQRNGRIDRTLQPSDIVRCAYFRYRDRLEDHVLATIVKKVATIQEDLGSLGAVIHERVSEALDAHGIDADTAARIDLATDLGRRGDAVREDLDDPREAKRIRDEIDRAARMLARSRDLLEYDSALLRDTLDVALERLGHGPMTPVPAEGGAPAFLLPPLPDSWATTLDTLRPPRPRDVSPWEHRRRTPPQPVVFDPPATMDSPRVHLHLHHPFVRRLLDFFLAQGHAAHDLQRVTVVRDRKAGEVRVLAFGRLCLFGRGAVRLHDALVPVVATWHPTTGPVIGAGDPREDQRALDRLESLFADPAALQPIARGRQREILARVPADFAALWPQIQAEADARAAQAAQGLTRRGATEAAQLTQLLKAQRATIQRTLGAPQLLLAGIAPESLSEAERRQLAEDHDFLRTRLTAIDHELTTEPADLTALYEIQLRRVEPVGLVYLWPEVMA